MLIHIVEDDENIRQLLLYTLHSTGYLAEGFSHGKAFFASLQETTPDLILLDIMLPEEDGLSILQKLKNNPQTKDIPIIMLTAKSAEVDKVIGLDTGADDYMTKPFGMMELLSRIKAVLRRTNKLVENTRLSAHGITLYPEQYKAVVNDELLSLTLKEFELLEYLMQHQGLVLKRDKILNALWGYDFQGETRTVDVHIGTLRQKLGDKANCIQTVRGIGYRMEAEYA